MPFKKGQSGNPGGHHNTKEWRDAIMRAMTRTGKNRTEAMDAVATALVMAAKDGDVSALKEIGDRIDGKPKQQIELAATITNESGDISETAGWIAGFTGTATPDPSPKPVLN